jgi:hypothetical protein
MARTAMTMPFGQGPSGPDIFSSTSRVEDMHFAMLRANGQKG